MQRYNCWEYKKCGREPGGTEAEELGVCPAATERKLDNVNYGKNGGRACWALIGTGCNGKKHSIFALHLAECAKCEFYQRVNEEEDWNYVDAKAILKKLSTA